MAVVSARALRRLHGWHALIWLGPGALASVILRDALWWVAFMSWWTLVTDAAVGWQAARAESAAD